NIQRVGRVRVGRSLEPDTGRRARAIGLLEAIRRRVLRVQGDVAAIAVEVRTPGGADAAAVAIREFRRRARGTEHLESLEVVLEDDVDRARYRIGAIDRRAADRDRLHAFD